MRRRAARIWLALYLTSCAGLPDVGTPSGPEDPEAGMLTLDGGRTVYIRPDALTYTGSAKFQWPDGRAYDGQFVDGRPDGLGQEREPDGSRYKGHWLRGQRHGVGVLELSDGGRYEGDFNQGMRSGLGTYEGPHGRYEGEWEFDAPQGTGEFVYPDGSRYDGEWDGGRRSGWGTYERAESTYEGEWVNDVPHGFGKAIDPSGFEYDGGWRAGEREGYGRTATRAGLAYEGTWVDGVRQGFGRELRPNGAEYLGEWRHDVRWGQGRSSQPDGSYHEGYWESDTPLGPGTRRTATGIEITGTWNGDFVTTGIVTLPSGSDFAGNLYDRANRRVDPRFLAWLERTAQEGDPHAQLLLGEAYQNFSEPAPDASIAMKWYARAAASGLAEAQYRVALLELESESEPRAARGLEWLLRAAEQQHAGANLLLGSYYQTGRLVPRNHKRAATYYEVAMAAGSEMARNNLAWLLATSPRDTLRDGVRAVQLSEPIAILYDDWGYLDTLAAAWAERGDFDAAVRTQQRAVRLAQGDADDATLHQMEERLSLFQQLKPYRE